MKDNIECGDRVDTPFGLGIVTSVGPHELIDLPRLITVDLEVPCMTVEGTALLDPDDVDLFQKAGAH